MQTLAGKTKPREIIAGFNSLGARYGELRPTVGFPAFLLLTAPSTGRPLAWEAAKIANHAK